MPVTIKSEGIQIKSIGLANEPDQSPLHLLKTACREEIEECQELLQSSFGGPKLQAVISGSSNGFVRGAIKAYNQHHALCIRPEDVWFASQWFLGASSPCGDDQG